MIFEMVIHGYSGSGFAVVLFAKSVASILSKLSRATLRMTHV